jgi:Bacteriophage holin family
MKTKLSIILLSILSILAPVKGMVAITVLFIWIDLFVGIWRSTKLKLPLRSRGFARTISKTLLYAGAIVCTFFLEKYILEDIIGMFISVDLILTKAFTFYCVFTELKSINESYFDVTKKDVLKSFKEFLTAKKQEWDEFK